MNWIIVGYIVSSVCAFVALREVALRDFGAVTIGGLIALLFLSAIPISGPLTALAMIMSWGWFAKPVWRRR